MFAIMGNLCCGGDELEAKNQQTIAGGAPPPKVMTPTEDERREQARAAAEERARVGAVRGTQRYQCVEASSSRWRCHSSPVRSRAKR